MKANRSEIFMGVALVATMYAMYFLSAVIN